MLERKQNKIKTQLICYNDVITTWVKKMLIVVLIATVIMNKAEQSEA